MKRSNVCSRQYRPYYNLPSRSEHGRKMTGFLTPYRHWMWKQNELWRNVHEAQFEHLRRVYKRQWLESFRVNADEYICKYNITKAAQLAEWEHEMHAQEKKRVENQQLAQGRQALKKKHLDLLREFHERQFFYWYERASERLQYMAHINYVPQAQLAEHIDHELDKYVAHSKTPYPLNFAGQLPMLEDEDGNIVQVPANLMTNHTTENQDSSATMYQPPQGTVLAEEKLLEMMASAQDEELILNTDDSSAFTSTLSDIAREEDERDAAAKVARSMEETNAEREISRRSYIDRGKTGSRAIFRPSRLSDDKPPPDASSTTPMKRRRSTLDKAHALQVQMDAAMARASSRSLVDDGATEKTKHGEVASNTGRIRDRVVKTTYEELSSIEELRKASTIGGSGPSSGTLMDRRYGRGKFKDEKGKSDEDL